MTLYNCKHDGDQYRITKFDEHMNVESSYLCSFEECQCPAGVKRTCRHREMVPRFVQREAVGTEWMYDYDRGGWVQMGDEWAKPEPTPREVEEQTFIKETSQKVEAAITDLFMKRRFL